MCLRKLKRFCVKLKKNGSIVLMIIGLVSIKSKWELNSTSCEWVLVGNNEPEPEFDWFFIMEHFMKEQYHGILDLLFKGRSGTIYFIPHFTDGEEI